MHLDSPVRQAALWTDLLPLCNISSVSVQLMQKKIYFSTSVFQANQTAIVCKYISKYKLLVEINIFSCYPLQTFKTITQLNLKVLVHRATIQYSFPLKSKLGQIYHTFGFTRHSMRKGYKLPRERKSGFRPAPLLLCGF